MTDAAMIASEAQVLINILRSECSDRAAIEEAIRLGIECHRKMSEPECSEKRSGILYALTGARLLSAVQKADALQPGWVMVHEEQCCSCAGRWIHAFALLDADLPREWLSAAEMMLDRLQSINPAARDWVPELKSDLKRAQVRRDAPSVAALINYFNDEDMLRWQLEGDFLDGYDRVYIWDGPYRYLNSLALFRDASPRLDQCALGRVLLADPRVVYHYGLWDDERQKRVHAYEAIEEDIVVLHDTDEFPRLDSARLRSFWRSERAVGCLQLENLYAGGVAGASEHYPGDALDRLPLKWVIFKRRAVSAAEHINYLWLVGIEQEPMNQNLLDPVPFCHAYHLTGCRSGCGQANKIAFYMALALRNHSSDPVMDRLNALVDAGELSLVQARKIFLAGNSGYRGVPHPDAGFWLRRRLVNSSFSEVLMHRILQEGLMTVEGMYLLLDYYPLYVWVPDSSLDQSLTLQLQYPSTVKVRIWRWINGERPTLMDDLTLKGSLLTLNPFERRELGGEADRIGDLLMIQAVSDDSSLCWQSLRLGWS